ncbi:PTS sugar transporter subunit IIC [Amphibacillus sp. Q70]|uniref:PTS sugar transporter subunit IIC n=1 Tax=Amphibacillus sp. Q70 TaxID=3453416 RepID=UPI003F855C83
MQGFKKIFDGFLNVVVKISSTKALVALKDGFVLTMPITLIGSLFLLVGNIPIEGYGEFMANLFGADWNIGLNQVVGATFDILAIVTVIGIAYFYARNDDEDGISSAIIALVSFLVITASSTVSESGEVIGGVIPKDWTGAQGVITAIIIGLISGAVFTFFKKKKITIKMPDGVPQGVSNSFAALIPGLVIILGSMIVYQVLQVAFDSSLTQVIFDALQVPMQNLSDSFIGGLVITLLISLLFWAGLHGPNIVMGVMAPILTTNALANNDLLASGNLTVADGANIITPQLIDVYVKFGGTGITLGLLIAAIITAKSKQMRSVSKLSIIPGIFNINEPVIFGLPIVYNPFMLIPFILVPTIGFIITYVAIAIGFMPPFSGVQIPWTAPPIISGFILNGFSGALIQLIILAISVAIYWPFMKAQDKNLVEQESTESE